MAKNGKDTKHNMQLDRRVHCVINGKEWKIHKIDWCKGGIQMADIATRNVGENDINPRVKYIMARIDNW